MKTIQDYMNDPRILNDPLMKKALEPVKQIHAIRLKLQDETAGMTVAEEAEYHRKKTEKLFADFDLPSPQYVDLSGQGKVKPRPTMVSIGHS
ncbi:MAG: hypothetical protein LBH35_06395 [Treponema sp.]|jgi:hypothetical protein|nr:hypothetical protein [Treponema sp.]